MTCSCKKAVNIFESASTPYRIGKTGENVYQEIEFNFSKWLSEYPDAKIDLLIRVPKNGFYLLAEGITESTYLWKPSAFDLANPGRAAVMARMSSGEVRAKSDPIPFEIVRSMDYNLDISEPGPTRPSLMDEWIEDIYEAAARYPKIGEDNYWYVWDVVDGDWKKTDTYAGGTEGKGGIVYIAASNDYKVPMSASEIIDLVNDGKYPILNFIGLNFQYSGIDNDEPIFSATGIRRTNFIQSIQIRVHEDKSISYDTIEVGVKSVNGQTGPVTVKEPIYLTVTDSNGTITVDKTPTEIDALSAAGYDVHLRHDYLGYHVDYRYVGYSARLGMAALTASNGMTTFIAAIRSDKTVLLTYQDYDEQLGIIGDQITELQSDKADKTELPTEVLRYVAQALTEAEKAQARQNIGAASIADLGTVFTLKGGVATVNDLPQTGNSIGDVWYVESVSAGFIWITSTAYPNGYWEELGETVDLFAYAEKTWVEGKGYQTAQDVQMAISTAVSGKADKTPRVAMTAADEVVTISPNVEYVWPEMAELRVTLGTITDNTILNEFHFFFYSGATPTLFGITGIKNGSELPNQLDANKLYEFSSLEGVAILTPHELDEEVTA